MALEVHAVVKQPQHIDCLAAAGITHHEEHKMAPLASLPSDMEDVNAGAYLLSQAGSRD
jgi:hypothetical protein